MCVCLPQPNDYLKLRTFIMGIKNQPMFPAGVVYEGVDAEPKHYRGESGANDSIIPTCDNLFQLEFPRNPLTEILEDFRSYRPIDHNRFLASVAERARATDFRAAATSTPDLAVWYLANVDLVREFRQRHWNFTKEYIIKHSSHPVATGGSPITTWLPNQLGQVMRIMEGVDQQLEAMERAGQRPTADNQALLETIRRRYRAQIRILSREVDELSRKFGQEASKTV
jgi:indoleamine 2,3-dioxygenase